MGFHIRLNFSKIIKSMTGMEKVHSSCHRVHFSAVLAKLYFLHSRYDVRYTFQVFLDRLPFIDVCEY